MAAPSSATQRQATDGNALAALFAAAAASMHKNNNDNNIKFRTLETWQDDGFKAGDESLYKDLMDTDDANGWSADEMFKYNEEIHKVTTTFNDKTMSRNYTIPLPENSNKTTRSKNRKRLAAKIAKEIEEAPTAQGRLTPESSDDDELYEIGRLRRSKITTQNDQNLQQNTSTTSSSSRNILRNSLNASSIGMNDDSCV